MSTITEQARPGKLFWAVGCVGLVWNAMGVMTYLKTVTISQKALESMPAAERALHTNVPALVTSAYAIAVFGGTLACALLLLRKSWAVPTFFVSMAAVLVQMGHNLLLTQVLDVRGFSAAILPLMIIAIAAYLLWFSHTARKRGWLS